MTNADITKDSLRERMVNILDQEIQNGMYEPDYNAAIPRLVSLFHQERQKMVEEIEKLKTVSTNNHGRADEPVYVNKQQVLAILTERKDL